ncbi:MAG: CRISPR-associated endoribonuclease Cas6 [Desulfotomaculum sp.]|nr:CRISPR-associated endoribonuclease Cas6 [Desulfotomaculum sp.]
MLQKYAFNFTCTKQGAVKGLGGTEIHGLLFALLKEVNADAATRLHEAVHKPFALEPLKGELKREGKLTYINEGEKYSFTIACLTEEIGALLARAADALIGRIIKLGTGEFLLTGVVEQYNGGIRYQQILDCGHAPSDITFKFLTPTSFRQRGTQLLFPLPELVFSSLMKRWNAFSPVKLHEDTDFSFIRVKKYNLSTQMVQFEKYMVAGFVGSCTFNIHSKNAGPAQSCVYPLARFAEFAGVGYKPTMGLGRVKLVNKRKEG